MWFPKIKPTSESWLQKQSKPIKEIEQNNRSRMILIKTNLNQLLIEEMEKEAMVRCLVTQKWENKSLKPKFGCKPIKASAFDFEKKSEKNKAQMLSTNFANR